MFSHGKNLISVGDRTAAPDSSKVWSGAGQAARDLCFLLYQEKGFSWPQAGQ